MSKVMIVFASGFNNMDTTRFPTGFNSLVVITGLESVVYMFFMKSASTQNDPFEDASKIRSSMEELADVLDSMDLLKQLFVASALVSDPLLHTTAFIFILLSHLLHSTDFLLLRCARFDCTTRTGSLIRMVALLLKALFIQAAFFVFRLFLWGTGMPLAFTLGVPLLLSTGFLLKEFIFFYSFLVEFIQRLYKQANLIRSK